MTSSCTPFLCAYLTVPSNAERYTPAIACKNLSLVCGDLQKLLSFSALAMEENNLPTQLKTPETAAPVRLRHSAFSAPFTAPSIPKPPPAQALAAALVRALRCLSLSSSSPSISSFFSITNSIAFCQ